MTLGPLLCVITSGMNCDNTATWNARSFNVLLHRAVEIQTKCDKQFLA